MALKMDVVDASDNTISGAYFKIVTTIVEWEANYAVFILQAWKGKAAYNNGKKPLQLDQNLSFRMDFVAGSDLIIKSEVYNWLLIQPYFATAIIIND